MQKSFQISSVFNDEAILIYRNSQNFRLFRYALDIAKPPALFFLGGGIIVSIYHVMLKTCYHCNIKNRKGGKKA